MQPAETLWPGSTWPKASLAADVQGRRLSLLASRLVASPAPAHVGDTHALVAIHRGELVLEAYDDEGSAECSYPSWSIAKSVLYAAVGIAVRNGLLDPAEPVDVPAWQQRGDPRRAITLEQLLRMQSGLAFDEESTDLAKSSTMDMLFGAGKSDVAHYAAGFESVAAPGTQWSYSSGTSNIISSLLGQALGGGATAMREFLTRELFDPLGMSSVKLRFDDAGTWIASSFLFATARDFARFGLFCLRDGVWRGDKILPDGWMDAARTPTPGSQEQYGAHFWLSLDGSATFAATGFRGQYLAMLPERDLVLVRLGSTLPEQKRGTLLSLRELAECFPR